MKPSTSLTLLALLGLSLACSGGEDTSKPTAPEPSVEPAPAEAAPPTAKLTAPPNLGPGALRGPKLGPGAAGPGAKGPGSGSRFHEIKRTCCTNGRVNRLLDKYLNLQEALAGQDTEASWEALIASAKDAQEEGALDAKSHAAVAAIEGIAQSAQAQELVDQQASFAELYPHMELLVSTHGGGARAIGAAMDPQQERKWFQREGKPSNPVGGQRAVFVE